MVDHPIAGALAALGLVLAALTIAIFEGWAGTAIVGSVTAVNAGTLAALAFVGAAAAYYLED